MKLLGTLFIYRSVCYWRLWYIYKCYIVNWRINKLVLPHSFYFGAKHILLSSKRPLPCWRPFHSNKTNTRITLMMAKKTIKNFCKTLPVWEGRLRKRRENKEVKQLGKPVLKILGPSKTKRNLDVTAYALWYINVFIWESGDIYSWWNKMSKVLSN